MLRKSFLPSKKTLKEFKNNFQKINSKNELESSFQDSEYPGDTDQYILNISNINETYNEEIMEKKVQKGYIIFLYRNFIKKRKRDRRLTFSQLADRSFDMR